MPIRGKALLEIWLDELAKAGVSDVLVNLHYHAERVRDFLARPKFGGRIHSVFEETLLGTAGTLRTNAYFYRNSTLFMAHADNFCLCDFRAFIDYHRNGRPKETLMTMMTFRTDSPQTCGIVEPDNRGVVQKFHEKVKNPPGNLANAAIYLLEPEVVEWVIQAKADDFSTQVLPEFLGRIATWENRGIMRDIGSPESLRAAQAAPTENLSLTNDPWQERFLESDLQLQLKAFYDLDN